MTPTRLHSEAQVATGVEVQICLKWNVQGRTSWITVEVCKRWRTRSHGRRCIPRSQISGQQRHHPWSSSHSTIGRMPENRPSGTPQYLEPQGLRGVWGEQQDPAHPCCPAYRGRLSMKTPRSRKRSSSGAGSRGRTSMSSWYSCSSSSSQGLQLEWAWACRRRAGRVRIRSRQILLVVHCIIYEIDDDTNSNISYGLDQICLSSSTLPYSSRSRRNITTCYIPKKASLLLLF